MTQSVVSNAGGLLGVHGDPLAHTRAPAGDSRCATLQL